MRYKDLIYKITSSNNSDQLNLKKVTPSINKAKASVQIKDVLIGILKDDNLELINDDFEFIKRKIERTLTVLTNNPILDTFSFLPYSLKTLKLMVDIFPDKNFYYVSERDEYEEAKKLKKEKLNIKLIYTSMNKKRDFVDKIDYLVTINKEVEPTMQAILDKKNVLIFPIEIIKVGKNNSQKEKLVKPNQGGWIYNPATGMWVKQRGNDGIEEIPGWKAPDDWRLNPNP